MSPDPFDLAKYTYDADGDETSETDYSGPSDTVGQTTTYQYNDLGQLVKETLPSPDGNPAHAPFTTYTYDADGNKLTADPSKGSGLIDAPKQRILAPLI
jgi:YD repeat-containing protein